MPAEELEQRVGRYFSIIKGTLSVLADESDEKSVKREFEKADGSTGVKWEKHYKNISGVISDMTFQDTDYGERFSIHLTDGVETDILSFGTDSRYFADFAKKLPNIDLSEDIVISPYDFESTGFNGKEKRVTGLDIRQDGQKIQGYYYDAVKKENINGFPNPDGEIKDFDKDDWKVYFVGVKKFLKKEVQKVDIPFKSNETEATPEAAEAAFDDSGFE